MALLGPRVRCFFRARVLCSRFLVGRLLTYSFFLAVFRPRVSSVISRFAVHCISGLIRFLGFLVFPVARVFGVFVGRVRLLGCLAFSVARVQRLRLLVWYLFSAPRVSNVFSFSCVERLQFLVCLAFSVAHLSRVCCRSRAERFRFLMCLALGVLVSRAFSVARGSRFSVARGSRVFGYSYVGSFLVSRVSNVLGSSRVERLSVTRVSSVFSCSCVERKFQLLVARA